MIAESVGIRTQLRENETADHPNGELFWDTPKPHVKLGWIRLSESHSQK